MYINKKTINSQNDCNIKTNIINGIASVIALSLVNPFFAKFAERIGASDYHIAYLSSLPAFISIFALLPGALIIEGFNNKKITTAIILFSNKIFYILLAFVPFISSNYQPWVFVILVGLMNFPGSIYRLGYQSCIGDIFDLHSRSRAMSLRNRYSDMFRLLATFIAGQLLKVIPSNNSETIKLYQIFFIIAFVISMIEVFSFLKFKFECINEKTDNFKSEYIKRIKETIKNIPKQKDFISFVIASLIFHFGWQMGWPLFNIYNIKYLNADEGWLSAISIASGLSSIITVSLWGKLADKKGNSLVLSIATLGMALTPILVANARNLITLVWFNIIIGISVSGTILVLFNILLEVTPSKNRTIYIALYTTLISISATISPLIGVWLKDKFSIYIALVIVGVLRLIGSVSFFIRRKYLRSILKNSN